MMLARLAVTVFVVISFPRTTHAVPPSVPPVKHHSAQCEQRPLGPIGPHEELNCTEFDFRLHNLELRTTGGMRKAACGGFKCFYRLRRHPEVGYIVQPYQTETPRTLRPVGSDTERSTMVTAESWESSKLKHEAMLVENRSRARRYVLHELTPFAQMLVATYHIKHGLIGPPLVIDITEKASRMLGMQAYLSAKDPKSNHLDEQRKFLRATMRRFSAGSLQLGDHGGRYWSVLVQRTEAAPRNAIFIKCKDDRYPKPRDVGRVNPKFAAVVGKSHNATMLHNLHQGLVATARMVEAHLCLAYDFQAMVAPVTGDIYQIDLDRCGVANAPNNINRNVSLDLEYSAKCGRTLQLLARRTLARLAEVSHGRVRPSRSSAEA